MANKKDEPEKEVQPEEIVEDKEETPPEEPKEETPPQEPEQSEEEEPAPEEPIVEEEGEKEAPQPMSKRKAERLAKLENLVSKLKADETPTTVTPTGMDYGTELNADEETIARLEADRKSAAQTSFNEGLERAKSIQFHTRWELDSPRIESKYPMFDVSSPEFKEETAKSIVNWYMSTVGYDPITDTVVNEKLRLYDFVEGIMELSDSMAGAKVETTKKNIAKQAAYTGIRPDGSAAKMNLNKAPEDMTDDELKEAMKRVTRSLRK